MGTLATALGHIVLKLFTLQINAMLGFVALVSLMCWLISDGHAGDPATWCIVWVLHFAAMSSIDIRKGGVK